MSGVAERRTSTSDAPRPLGHASTLSGLRAALDGEVWLPGDDSYARVRRGFVGGDADLLPSAAAACVSTQDVVRSLGFARSAGLPFAVRSGGHSYADRSSTAGLLIELRGLRTIRLDGELLTVGPGARLGEIQRALAERGRSLPTGSCASVGIGGSTIAGGFGFQGRSRGLTADSLLAAEVVLADGCVVRVGSGREPDLDWALRGGGTLGVVTELVFRTYPARPVTIFHVSWPLDEAVELIDRWQRWAPHLPREVTAHLALTLSDHADEEPVVELFGCALREAVPEFASFLASSPRGFLDEPKVTTLHGQAAAGYLSGSVWRRGEEFEFGEVSPVPPRPGFQRATSEFFGPPIPVDAIAALVAVVGAVRVPGEQRDVEFTPWGGAYADIAPDATAFVHRRPGFLVAHRAVLGANAGAQRRADAAAWVRDCRDALAPHGTGAVYQGYQDPQVTDAAYYGANLPRLRAIRAAVDAPPGC
ncbi:hypothetical protein F4553_002437 [Allocatelliglobosispora scoriae]|uniref:FAD-binding PCMH-type domain-containing protein n=1 Tax=Allocatelliglobosispora scoriae TaxID=643052 RepID=A0A841BNU1_9ACTN|nr:FAD-binding oxidoreductase [Allocatelliglobosispora scoriae]MBB5869058.1 hypothetical protein [Allocatelliglobosispora scoriae]